MKLIFTIFTALLVAAAIILGISLYLQPNDLVNCPSQPTGEGGCQKADAVIAISGGDTTSRTQAAINLYKNGWADRVIFSGAAQDKSGPSNAAAMQQQAIAEGVPSEAIIIEEQSADTSENATNSEMVFEENDIHSVILVTSGYHQRRATLEFQRIAKDVTIINAPTDDREWNMWWWLRPHGWYLAGGELVKIIIFYAGRVSL